MTQMDFVTGSPLTQAAAVWTKACDALKSEIGAATFGSWVAQAALHEDAGGALVVVTPTGIAADWIRRNAWRRLSELWSKNDPKGRRIALKSKTEYEAACGCAATPSACAEAAAVVRVEPAEDQIIEIKPARAARPAGLQERFTFDTFVAGPTNEFAHAVARRVASWADGHFNPVLFHAPYGFGKTHLLNAIAHEAARARPDKHVVYLTAERFLSTFLNALRERSTSGFKEELRRADLLLIDDAHFVAGKPSTQEELFQTLAELVGDGRRVVLSSDRPPAALTEMDARLRSHLAAGLVCGIEPADRTLRLAILERKLEVLCRQQGLKTVAARVEVLEFLADRFTDSVRELEGALNTLVASAGESLAKVGLEDAQALLRPHLRTGERRITVDEIQKVTSDHYGLKQAELLSERRTRAVARPRQTAMWLCKHLTTRSLPDIGRRVGGRDHTTVLHAVRRIEALRAEDATLAGDIEALIRKLRG